MTTTSERTLYLRRCALVSLRKRWYYGLLSALVFGTGTFILNSAVLLSLLLALLACAVTLILIAIDSVRRHGSDVPGGTV